jgi:hypothetical protein
MSLKSKALKEFPARLLREECGCPKRAKHDHNFLYKAGHKILSFFMHEIYYPVESFFRRHKERISRSYAYAKFGYHNYDFDFSYVYQLINFKLKRLYKALENGHAEQDPEDMKALRDLTKLVYRLSRGRYEDKYLRQHDKKWGKLQSRFEDIEEKDSSKSKYSKWITWRDKCPENALEETKANERAEFKKCYDLGEDDRVRDIGYLGNILIHHGPSFWD